MSPQIFYKPAGTHQRRNKAARTVPSGHYGPTSKMYSFFMEIEFSGDSPALRGSCRAAASMHTSRGCPITTRTSLQQLYKPSGTHQNRNEAAQTAPNDNYESYSKMYRFFEGPLRPGYPRRDVSTSSENENQLFLPIIQLEISLKVFYTNKVSDLFDRTPLASCEPQQCR